MKLIAIDTTNPPGINYREAVDFLAPLCRRAGYTVQRVNIPKRIDGGRLNLLAHRRSRRKPRLLVYSHVDVVPADDDWKPFEPRIRNGRMVGRGTADMKGCIMAFLAASRAVKEREWAWDTTLMVTTDEETNQFEQLEYLFEKKLDGVQGATFLDLDSAFGYVSIGGLGHMSVRITVRGRSVHSGISHTGVNAVERAVPVLQALQELKKRVESRFSGIPTHPATGIRRMQAKLNINMIHGGLKVNIVPDTCVIEVDRRLIPEENLRDARKELLSTLKPLGREVDLKIDIVHEMPGYGKVSEAALRLAECHREVMGSGDLFGTMGSGDMLTMAHRYNWQIAGCGVGREGESNLHGRDENMRLKDFERMKSILELFLVT
jgi:succinyl-diaminopimelate desuccinylase